jgi:putative endonuclease
MKERCGVYIMRNQTGTLYTGMSENISKSVLSHKEKEVDGFTKKYNCTSLVYFEFCDDTWQARIREKQIKHLGRTEKITLIQSVNPLLIDLYGEIK